LNKIFSGKKVLITGHTGFKGSWLSLWLHSLGADIFGVSDKELSIPSNFNASSIEGISQNYYVDIRDLDSLRKLISKIQPDFVFHLAAQALVRPSYINPLDTVSTNAIGTGNVLESLRDLEKKVVAVIITSDKVYDNVEWVWGYKETDKIGGIDPYSASKGMAEILIRSYCKSFFNSKDCNIKIGVTRAGNVIGGGDWAVDRIVPDCMRSWSKGRSVDIRNPNATRPWQHVLEPLSGYIWLALNLEKNNELHGETFNFGPLYDMNYPVYKLIDEMAKHWDKVNWNDVSNSNIQLHEASLLKLNCDKALFDLNWHSNLGFEDTIKMTVEWYKKYYQNPKKSMLNFSLEQIKYFTDKARKNKILWALHD